MLWILVGESMDICKIIVYLFFIVVEFLKKWLIHKFHLQFFLHSDVTVLSRGVLSIFNSSVQKVSLASYGEECNYFWYLLFILFIVVEKLYWLSLATNLCLIHRSKRHKELLTTLYFVLPEFHLRIYRNNWTFSRNMKYFSYLDSLLYWFLRLSL